MHFLSSSLLTAVLAIGMACYLLQGKYLSGDLSPGIMVAFAVALLLQSLLALFPRVRRLYNNRNAAMAFPAKGVIPLRGTVADVISLLRRRGYTEITVAGEQSSSCLVKGERRAAALECGVYFGLLFTLAYGVVNYGFGVTGFVDVTSGSEWLDLRTNLQVVQKGFLVPKSGVDYSLRGEQLKSALGKARPEITLHVVDSAGKQTVHPGVKAGTSFDVGNFRFYFRGDNYLAFLSVMQGNNDFLAAPLHLQARKGPRGVIYAGRLDLAHAGATGAGEYDPAAKTFSFMLDKKGTRLFDGRFPYGEEGRQGDVRIVVTALGHYGRFDVTRHYYRNQIFAGMIIMVAALLLRVVLMPGRVWIWEKDGKQYCYTRNIWLRRKLGG